MVNKNEFFERNLLALSKRNPELCSRLRIIGGKINFYEFRETRTGEIIPALPDSTGKAHPLHSMMDPRKEAGRLISTVENESFLVLLGLGGAYYAEAALERDDIGTVIVIEYNLNGLAELLREIDYTHLFADPRFFLLADATESELEEIVLGLYQPILCGGIRVIPIRSRTSQDPKRFNMAAGAIQAAIDRISADYTVQAHFGKRWLSNIVRNLKNVKFTDMNLPQIYRAAVTAAGPSLSKQIPDLRKKRKCLFLIATDTSLPCLLYEGLTPDAVISIDCQHISYYHFMHGLPEEVILFLDLASPPLLSTLSKRHRYFSTGHPLTRYISRHWKTFPALDTSGGNVTYAAMSLAEQLGAREIEIYGADFSYPGGVSYARGAYIYTLFEKSQNRFSPLEAQYSAFLYRTLLSKKNLSDNSWYYETGILKFYRERLEEKSKKMKTAIIAAPGLGAPIYTGLKTNGIPEPNQNGNSEIAGKIVFKTSCDSDKNTAIKAGDFLDLYLDLIVNLPKPGKNASDYFALLNDNERELFTTLLPLAAALKQDKNPASFAELFEEIKAYCESQIRA